jgi:uncharacterized membrane protein HdeD (DUF308 family)
VRTKRWTYVQALGVLLLAAGVAVLFGLAVGAILVGAVLVAAGEVHGR